MIAIAKDNGLVTLINVFTCEPDKQDDFVRTWLEGVQAGLGTLPGLVSSSLHRSLDGTRVINYAQWRSVEDWEHLVRVGKAHGHFQQDAHFATADPHLYEVVYTLDRTTSDSTTDE